MYKILSSQKLTPRDHKNILASTLIFTNCISLLLYIVLRALFYDTPITPEDDLIALGKTSLIGTTIAVALYSILLIIEITDYLLNRTTWSLQPILKYAGVTIGTMLIFYLSACRSQMVAGVHKDLNTGLTTSYKNIEAGNTLLVMNNEVLNHTDIPLGENFLLINDDIKGMTEKNGTVSAGCELVIKDKEGKLLLKEADLFKGADVFAKEKLKSLKCTIYTGKPMEWDEQYDVSVTFWDKFGTGKIENTFSITMTDIP